MTESGGGLRVYISNRQKALKVRAGEVRRAAGAAATYGGIAEGGLSVVIVGDRKMRSLNREWAKHEGTTDVLAFELGDEVGAEDILGEVIVNAAVAKKEAEKRGKTARDELLLYVVHGVLHLGGYRDTTRQERRRMRSAERTVLRRLSLGEI